MPRDRRHRRAGPPRPHRPGPGRTRPDRQPRRRRARRRAAGQRLARAAADHVRLPAPRRAAGRPQQRETYDRGNGATILLYDPERRTVLLTRQFRYPAYVNGHPDGMLVETAAGPARRRRPGDRDPPRGRRGDWASTSATLEHVFDVYMSPGSVTERLHFYAAPYTRGDPHRTGRRARRRRRGHRGRRAALRRRARDDRPTAGSPTRRRSCCCSGRRSPGPSESCTIRNPSAADGSDAGRPTLAGVLYPRVEVRRRAGPGSSARSCAGPPRCPRSSPAAAAKAPWWPRPTRVSTTTAVRRAAP